MDARKADLLVGRSYQYTRKVDQFYPGFECPCGANGSGTLIIQCRRTSEDMRKHWVGFNISHACGCHPYIADYAPYQKDMDLDVPVLEMVARSMKLRAADKESKK